MPITSPAEIDTLLKAAKTIAVEIASPKPERTSNQVMRFLIDQGFDVYPINPGFGGKEIAGRMAYASLADVPVPIDIVDVFRKSEEVGPIVERAISIGAKAVWMQLGVVNDDAAQQAKEAGLSVVMDRCTAIELKRLKAAS